MITVGTNYVMRTEPALNLSEMNLQSPGSRGWRRYQIITVIRDDKPADYKKDLGPANAFKADQFRILGGVLDTSTRRGFIEHTVEELKEIAEGLRQRPSAALNIEPTIPKIKAKRK